MLMLNQLIIIMYFFEMFYFSLRLIDFLNPFGFAYIKILILTITFLILLSIRKLKIQMKKLMKLTVIC